MSLINDTQFSSSLLNYYIISTKIRTCNKYLLIALHTFILNKNESGEQYMNLLVRLFNIRFTEPVFNFITIA